MTGVKRQPFHALSPADAIAAVGSGANGLSAGEAAERLRKHGPNVIESRAGRTAFGMLVDQLKSPLIWVLLGSGALAILLGKPTDGSVVLAVVVLNTLIGFAQEYRAAKSIEALGEMVPEHAVVLRGGERITVVTRELVVGDILELAAGDRVPADARLMRAHQLRVEEAALTGESVPVDKTVDACDESAAVADRTSMVFGGTLVRGGSARSLVVATGADTELGRISGMLDSATELDTPLTQALASVSRILTIAILVVSLALTGLAYARGYGIADAAMVAITLAVAAIPEGLPAVVTIALAIGVRRMARRHAIVRKLPAVETLGSTSVICSDKTGTLTKNEMTVQAVWHGEAVTRVGGLGYEPEGELSDDDGKPKPADDGLLALARAAVLCSDATVARRAADDVRVQGDPTEAALVVLAEKLGLDPDGLRRDEPRIGEIPFDSSLRLMATRFEEEGTTRVFVKGAPEAVLRRLSSPHGPSDEALNDLAARGLRLLAIASRELPPDVELDLAALDGLELLGVVGMIDPPRHEAVAAVRACKEAGIVVKMITGDHRMTASAIARELGIDAPDRAVAGSELAELTPDELKTRAHDTNVFARVAPEHKLALVHALQQDELVVAMTGDGVNDAPALKQADIGVAMGLGGTAVARDASDIVLTDDNFATIYAAVEEGRRVYDNLVKSLAFLLPTNIGLALIMAAAVVLFPIRVENGQPVPLSPMAPVQILWINLVAAVALALPLAFEPLEPSTMKRQPRSRGDAIVSPFVIRRTVVASILMAIGAVGLFAFELLLREQATGASYEQAQTMAVSTVISFQIFFLFAARTFERRPRGEQKERNRMIWVGTAVTCALQAAFIYLPAANALFDSAPLSPLQLGLSVILGMPVYALFYAGSMLAAHRRQKRRPEGT